MSMPASVMFCCVLAGGLLSIAGCNSSPPGPIRHAVAGKIDLDGEPVATGSITFLPAAGTNGPTAGDSIVDGAYSIPRDKGLVAGNYRVEIRSPRPTGKKIAAQSPAPPGTMTDEIKESIPAQFNSNSTLEAEIPAESDNLDFTLTP